MQRHWRQCMASVSEAKVGPGEAAAKRGVKTGHFVPKVRSAHERECEGVWIGISCPRSVQHVNAIGCVRIGISRPRHECVLEKNKSIRSEVIAELATQ